MNISNLIGQIITRVEEFDTGLIFITRESAYLLEHTQNCCENVYIESITGDLSDLLNFPILKAEEAISCDSDNKPDFQDESFTWTFYKLATIKGYVDIRFYGTSNGYYSETVDFIEINQEYLTFILGNIKCQ